MSPYRIPPFFMWTQNLSYDEREPLIELRLRWMTRGTRVILSNLSLFFARMQYLLTNAKNGGKRYQLKIEYFPVARDGLVGD